MDQKNVRVLHIDTEKGWRGAQEQVGYLLEHMHKKGVKTGLVCQPRSAFRNFAKSHKLPHFSVEIKGEFDFIAGLHIALLAAKHRFNLLHLHSSNAISIGLWAKFFNRKLRLVASRRVDYHLRHSKFGRFKYINSYLNKIVCNSDRIRKILMEDRIPSSKLITIRNVVDLHKFDHERPITNLREQLGISHEQIIVGTIAALVSHKDYPNFISAAKLVAEQRNDVTFIAVGEGQQKRILEVMARSMGLKDKFIFTGFRDDVGNFLKIFDIFVFASRFEGMGTSILDAQAFGLPVIATNSGSIPEAVSNEQNGLLVTPNSPEDLAKAIIRLCDDPALRTRLGDRGRQTVQEFSIEKSVERYLKLYEELL